MMTEKPTCPHIVSSDEGTQYCGLGLDYARELSALARESVERDKTLAKLEAEVVASRDIVRKAVTRAEELERLVRALRRAERRRSRCEENFNSAIDTRWPVACEIAREELDQAREAADAARDALFAAVGRKGE